MDMAVVFAAVRLWFKVPQTIRFEMNSRLPDKVYSKDIILYLIGDVGAKGDMYMAAEYGADLSAAKTGIQSALS